MTVIENSVVIRRSQEDVFDYLVDLRHELEWNPQCRSMEKVTHGPIGVGTVFRAKWKQSPMIEVTCVAFERASGWCYTNGGPLAVTFTARLTREDDSTRLSTHFDVQPRGLMKLIFPIMLRSLRRAEQDNMHHIKRALESFTKQ
jgi:carbon monoxide dehydrogenase subunit G